MKVYVVIYDYYEELEVVGVFTDQDKATKFAESGGYYVQESTLDPEKS